MCTLSPGGCLAAVDVCLDIHTSQKSGDILVFLTGQDEIDKCVAKTNERICEMSPGSCGDLQVLPLYGNLQPEMQARIFAPVPEGCRRAVFATNVAETSLTVPGVVYVIDPGFVKQKEYAPESGMDKLCVTQISRSQATQRAGRAGRTCPGKCFRLYPKDTFTHEMVEASVPEIQRTSLVGTVLHLKSLRLQLDVLSFDFLDRPATEALEDALKQLFVLGAIDGDGQITEIGRQMSSLPLDPPLARAVIAARDFDCEEDMEGQGKGKGKGEAGGGTGDVPARALELDTERVGDHILLLAVYQAWQRCGYSADFCSEYGLQLRAMNFAKSVVGQLQGVLQKASWRKVQAGDAQTNDVRYPRDKRSRSRSRSRSRDRHGHREEGKKHKKEKKERKERRKDARRGRSRSHSPQGRSRSPKGRRGQSARGSLENVRQALTVGFANRIAHRMLNHNGYKTYNDSATLAELHPSSLHIQADEEGLYPDWVIYHELVSTTRPFLRQVCGVKMEWVTPLLPRLKGVNVQRLSGRKAEAPSTPSDPGPKGVAAGAGTSLDLPGGGKATSQNSRDANAAAARARYLARKAGASK
ncbi:hypothetical protein CYMTET_27620 [Cymbomonas tetramitiformis]|uniref:RNA helicase n=1 Tax=Cymbomonas tetramitiformis TaxID=36881 RepID=A0AAE0KWS3_9CHLO|nr:hypothetical protein CYMTET_27620 [Cymbomonas tetramitiformis]